ncbi:hypothetical protein DVDV_2275 [Desulfovibrio sp. DV]|nr:hypothetical protein DVDV_2275 [Desulfovibrio sp. DV]
MLFVLVKAEESRDRTFLMTFLLPKKQPEYDDYAHDQG